MASKRTSLADGIALAVCSCGGIGYLPRGPATAGALAGALVHHLLAPSYAVGVAMVLGALIVGAPLCQRLVRRRGESDPQLIVLDEVAGVWTAMIALPRTPALALAAVVLFRLFDKFKFGPARTLDRRGDGLGIMADDLVAGLYANLVLQLGVLVHGHLR